MDDYISRYPASARLTLASAVTVRKLSVTCPDAAGFCALQQLPPAVLTHGVGTGNCETNCGTIASKPSGMPGDLLRRAAMMRSVPRDFNANCVKKYFRRS
jgi:hypothetical protein